VLGLGLASAVLLFATEFATLSYRTIGIGGCESRVDPGVCTTSGGDAHSHVLWFLAIAVLAFAFGAAVGVSRPAALALLACGVAVVVIALAIDLPKLDDTRGLDASYTEVKAHTGTAYALELIGAALALAAGLVALRRTADSGQRTADGRE
jgi:uncharacterized membrane protein